MDKNVNTRLYGMLGFAMRAGKVMMGTDSICTAMAKQGKGKPSLVLIAENASEGTTKKLLHKAEFYGIKAIIINIDSSELGRLLGKLYAPAVVAIMDEHFASEIRLAVGDNQDGNDTN